jgi:glycosyltransferase involved in cell wall biosynthesis
MDQHDGVGMTLQTIPHDLTLEESGDTAVALRSAAPELLDPPERGRSLALVHDYLTQRGGAERVALLMAEALEDAPLYTSFFDPKATFPEFSGVDVRPFAVNRLGVLRRHHRIAMPLLAPLFSSLHVDADVVLCSTSGWAHGIQTEGRKIVYCYAPARWLYQTETYLGAPNTPALWASGLVKRQMGLKLALRMARPLLQNWDHRAAASAHRYLAVSKETAAGIKRVYGVEAEVVSPPPTLRAGGPEAPVEGIEPGYCLCTSRMLPYKNVGILVEAMQYLSGTRLVVVGDGPIRPFLESTAGPNVQFIGAVSDSQMRWLYRNCVGLVAASHEDYGLTPLEAATFGRPSAVLGCGGYLETVVNGETGIFFDNLAPNVVAKGIDEMIRTNFDTKAILRHAGHFEPDIFKAKILKVVDEESRLV